MEVERGRRPVGSDKAIWGLVTEASNICIALATFVVIGERLGPGQFGSLASLLVTAVLVGPLAMASPEHLAVQRIAQGMPVSEAWRRSSTIVLVVGPLVAIAMIPIAVVVSPSLPVLAVLLISLGEMVWLKLARVGIRTQEAAGFSNLGARIAISILLTRLAALLAFWVGGIATVGAWAVCHVAASAVAAIYAHASLRHPGSSGFDSSVRQSLLPSFDDYRLGMPFALNAGPDGLLSSNDQMVLSGSGQDVDSGIYAAAYRVATIAGTPARSVLRTRYASFFRPENQSADGAKANLRNVLRSTAPVGVLAGLTAFLLAPTATFVLGDDFAESVDALRLLAFLPVVRALSTPYGNVLTGTGRQSVRIMATLAAALLNLVLNLALIPIYGWRAAVGTTLLSEAVLLLVLAIVVVRLDSRPQISANGPT